ncbi:hypothetical protein RMN57_23725 [Kitasatospora sp. CM 4170]|uniref:Uncharacterized protein n=1 Tax=Kitasatospora aburaviensis TaxID=67265 RepID=A0ABW1EY57_9ACTN|nr:hypothetical protein [Kitasatospora sp. CM 4170]WNM47495.1 hypothetical protein RMN57_23725 [Kitasatospora sp. CM 4170]
MANDQSETREPTKTAEEAAVAAGKAVEGAVAASSNPTEYAEPTAAQKADLEDDLFGDESEHVIEPAAPVVGEPDEVYEPQNIISAHP